MKKFFNSMFSSSGDVSSKRFAALFTLVNVIILAYIATIKSVEKATPSYMYDGLLWIIVGGLGLASIDGIFKKKDNEPKKEDEDPTN